MTVTYASNCVTQSQLLKERLTLTINCLVAVCQLNPKVCDVILYNS